MTQPNMRSAIVPRSDQANFEDFLGDRTLTIKITKVTIKAGEQPVTINYEGDNGKPYKPCKTMCRVMVIVWGDDANAYIGRSLTLYGDPKVTWGGLAVGGVRISHMSHIDHDITMMLSATRASKKPYTIHPLIVQASAPAVITRDQGAEINIALKTAALLPEALFTHFNIKRLGELRADQINEVEKWIAAANQLEPVNESTGEVTDFCPLCEQTGGHSSACPDNVPPE